MTARDLGRKLGLSSAAISANDLVGAFGGVLAFIGFFLPMLSDGVQSESLASAGGFYGALVPIFAALCAIALLVPVARRFAPVWLSLAGIMLGLAVGSRDFLPFGYEVGWWLCLIGGIALCYGWIARIKLGTWEMRGPR